MTRPTDQTTKYGTRQNANKNEDHTPLVLVEQLVDAASAKARVRGRLTRGEQQLVPLIGQGLTNKEIAAQLNLSEQTVKNHIHRILQRMGAMNRFTAVEIARDRNLLPQP